MNELLSYIEERRPSDSVGRRILMAAATGYGDIGSEYLVESALTGRSSIGDTLGGFVGLELHEITEGTYPGDAETQWSEAIRRVESAVDVLQGVLDALAKAPPLIELTYCTPASKVCAPRFCVPSTWVRLTENASLSRSIGSFGSSQTLL